MRGLREKESTKKILLLIYDSIVTIIEGKGFEF